MNFIDPQSTAIQSKTGNNCSDESNSECIAGLGGQQTQQQYQQPMQQKQIKSIIRKPGGDIDRNANKNMTSNSYNRNDDEQSIDSSSCSNSSSSSCDGPVRRRKAYLEEGYNSSDDDKDDTEAVAGSSAFLVTRPKSLKNRRIAKKTKNDFRNSDFDNLSNNERRRSCDGSNFSSTYSENAFSIESRSDHSSSHQQSNNKNKKKGNDDFDPRGSNNNNNNQNTFFSSTTNVFQMLKSETLGVVYSKRLVYLVLFITAAVLGTLTYKQLYAAETGKFTGQVRFSSACFCPSLFFHHRIV